MLSAHEEGRQCLVKASSPQYKPNHSGYVQSVMQTPPHLAITTKCSQDPPVLREAPWDRQWTRTNRSSRMAPALRAPLMHNTTPLNTPLIELCRDYELHSVWPAKALQCHMALTLSWTRHKCFTTSCRNTSARTAEGRAPLLQDFQGKQLQKNPAFLMAHVTPCCSRGWGQWHLFYILQASGKRGFQRDLNTGP